MQRTGEVKLGELLSSYVDEVGFRDSFESLDVCEAWRAAVGQRAASATAYAYFKDSPPLDIPVRKSVMRTECGSGNWLKSGENFVALGIKSKLWKIDLSRITGKVFRF